MAANITRRVLGLSLLAGLPACAAAPHASALPETPALDARLASLQRLVGHWRGTVRGEPGAGIVERAYTPLLGGKFLEERNTSIHHHIAYWSFDRARFVLRQFHEESFVNQFVATTPDFVEGRFIVDSETIENIPPGFRARESYIFSSADAFEEIFEIAEPNADYQLYWHNRFTRA